MTNAREEIIQGLSPRARGNLFPPGHGADCYGPIPASAGEPAVCLLSTSLHRAYPRERGGTGRLVDWIPVGQGLSPRARGNPVVADPKRRIMGPIPASAGEPIGVRSLKPRQRAYPRERGGTMHDPDEVLDRWGLSPRARGNLQCRLLLLASARPIPASAGEPGSVMSFEPGGEGLSPRARGNPSRRIPCAIS